MVDTPSEMLPLGTTLPAFSLPDVVSRASVSSTDAPGERGLLVMFICNHCPFVVHVREALVKLAHDALDRGVGVLAINSNSATSHPQDGPPNMRALAMTEGWRFPFLFDAGQEVAKTFRAACTPDFYLFDGEGSLFYRGQLDGSRPRNDVPVTGADLGGAIDALVGGQEPPLEQIPSIGCNIKWSPGNAPDYFG